jgi:hypothetical protein
MVTKNEGGREGGILPGIVAIRGYFKFEPAVSLKNSLFPFPLAKAF